MGFISTKPGYAKPFCVESASAVSDAPSVAKPSVLRASKKLCERGGVLSLMNAAGGATNAVVGAMAEDSAGFTSMAAGATSEATRALAVDEEEVAVEDSFVEDAFALEVEAGVAESEAEAGVEAGEGRTRPSVAKADGDNNAKNMAATATLTSLPLT